MALVRERVPNFLIGFAIGVVFVVFLLIARSKSSQQWQDNPPTEVQKTIALQARWVDTPRPVTADDLRGRAIAMLFVPKKCDGCIGFLKALQGVEREFSEKLMSLIVMESWREGGLAALGVKTPFDHFVHDKDMQIAKMLGVQKLPAILFISPDGSLANQAYTLESVPRMIQNMRLLIDRFSSTLVIDPIK